MLARVIGVGQARRLMMPRLSPCSSSSLSMLANRPPRWGRAGWARRCGKAGAAAGPIRSRHATTWLAVAGFCVHAWSSVSRTAGASAWPPISQSAAAEFFHRRKARMPAQAPFLSVGCIP